MKTPAENNIWDVCVIGGGPAGMMAAGSAAKSGARVILIEKNKSLGKKLLITGGGRCNVTNAEFDTKKLLTKFKEGGKFLFSPFSKWSVKETIDFFHTKGMPTKEEAEKRVFPVSNSAQSVWDTLVSYLKETGVTVLHNAPVLKIYTHEGKIVSVEIKGEKHIYAKTFILATGGKSHPETGSTGDGYAWLKELKHDIAQERGALVPVATHESGFSTAAGVALKEAKITLFQNDVKQAQALGKVLFTHVGLSGPGILNMSQEIGELLKYGEVIIEIDLLPNLGYEKVNSALQELFKVDNNKKIKNVLSKMVPPALVVPLLESAEINPETACNSITRTERLLLIKTFKHCTFRVKHLLGLEKAIITAGGVELSEIDQKSMRSMKISNLYLVGDILNINRPSGGYSLQLCWTTGYVAGTSAAKEAATMN